MQRRPVDGVGSYANLKLAQRLIGNADTELITSFPQLQIVWCLLLQFHSEML